MKYNQENDDEERPELTEEERLAVARRIGSISLDVIEEGTGPSIKEFIEQVEKEKAKINRKEALKTLR